MTAPCADGLLSQDDADDTQAKWTPKLTVHPFARWLRRRSRYYTSWTQASVQNKVYSTGVAEQCSERYLRQEVSLRKDRCTSGTPADHFEMPLVSMLLLLRVLLSSGSRIVRIVTSTACRDRAGDVILGL